MKKQVAALLGLLLVFSIAMAGCSSSSAVSDLSSDEGSGSVSSAQADSRSGEDDGDIQSSNITELTVRFGDSGDSFVMHLENNSTAAAIAGYVGTADWRLPVYSYDESDVMEYYDIPSRYEIPDNSETVSEARAGDVFYSDPNRIVLYYHDAQINEQYTLIGTFDTTEEFVDAVENNPVLEGWGNQIVVISAGE